MNCSTKSILAALFISLSLFCRNASAQNEAIPSYNIVGNSEFEAFGGAGFEFVPTVSIEITALGFNGIDLPHSPYLVGLYNFNGNLLSSATVTTSSSFQNQTYYQSIAPVILPAFSTNYIGAAELSGNWMGNIIGTISGGGSFQVNSDIIYLASAVNFSGGAPLEQIPNNFFVDENFQFTVVPEPSVLSLGAFGLLGLAWRRWRA